MLVRNSGYLFLIDKPNWREMEDSTAHWFGHPICYDWNDKAWKYSDNGNPVDSEKRDCPRCGLKETEKGHDPCCADFPGAVSVCCGHGVHRPILITAQKTINPGDKEHPTYSESYP